MWNFIDFSPNIFNSTDNQCLAQTTYLINTIWTNVKWTLNSRILLTYILVLSWNLYFTKGHVSLSWNLLKYLKFELRQYLWKLLNIGFRRSQRWLTTPILLEFFFCNIFYAYIWIISFLGPSISQSSINC